MKQCPKHEDTGSLNACIKYHHSPRQKSSFFASKDKQDLFLKKKKTQFFNQILDMQCKRQGFIIQVFIMWHFDFCARKCTNVWNIFLVDFPRVKEWGVFFFFFFFFFFFEFRTNFKLARLYCMMLKADCKFVTAWPNVDAEQ